MSLGITSTIRTWQVIHGEDSPGNLKHIKKTWLRHMEIEYNPKYLFRTSIYMYFLHIPTVCSALPLMYNGATKPGLQSPTYIESLSLEETSKVIKSNHWPSALCSLNYVPKCHRYLLLGKTTAQPPLWISSSSELHPTGASCTES